MEDGDAHGYALEFSLSPVTGDDGKQILGSSRVSTRDDVYKGFFIPKGQIPLNCTFFLLIIRFKRIYIAWKCMVCQLSNAPESLSEKFQGDPAQPRDIPRSRGIQARALSQ